MELTGQCHKYCPIVYANSAYWNGRRGAESSEGRVIVHLRILINQQHHFQALSVAHAHCFETRNGHAELDVKCD